MCFKTCNEIKIMVKFIFERGRKMTIKKALELAIEKLNKSNIENPIKCAKLVLAYVLKQEKEYLVINDNKEITKAQEENFLKLINKLIEGYPIQYLTNKQEFMKLNFCVNENVLIPRQDTEILVEEVIKLINKDKDYKILDLCTGSGAIAVSLAKYIENCNIYATDISKNAIEVAKINAKNNYVDKKIKFINTNMFENISNEIFDLIVSNPPYIKTEDIDNLDKNVKYEPIIALDGGESGLEFYEIIVRNAYKYLNKNGYLCLEIGYNQKQDVCNLLKKSGKYKDIIVKKDLSGNDRVVIAKL